MIFNLVGLKARQTGSSIRTKVLLRAMLLDTTAHQDVLIKQALTVLAPFGRFVEIGKRDIEENNALPLRAFNQNLTFSAVDMDRLAAARPGTLRELLREIWDGFSAGRFHPVMTEIFPLADIGKACRLMMKAKHIGKCVLQVEDQEVPVLPVRYACSEPVA
jgi:NADPH:quinone reductase-like Zn-dependent oxidoreductase